MYSIVFLSNLSGGAKSDRGCGGSRVSAAAREDDDAREGGGTRGGDGMGDEIGTRKRAAAGETGQGARPMTGMTGEGEETEAVTVDAGRKKGVSEGKRRKKCEGVPKHHFCSRGNET